MPLQRRDLDLAVKDGVVSPEQAERLWARAARRERPPAPPDAPADPVHAGGAAAASAAAIAAAGWLLLVTWEAAGAAGAFVLAAVCTFAFGLGARELERRSLRAGAGLLACAAVALAPFAVHALHRWVGYGSSPGPAGTVGALVRNPYFPAVIAAIAMGAAALRVFSSPAVVAMLTGAIWSAVMLAAPLVFGPSPSWSQRALLSALTGIGAMGTGVALDGRTRRDASYWLYLAGLIAFWGGLATIDSETSLPQLLGAAVYVALVLVSIALRRHLFALFGAVGLAGALGRVAEIELDDAVIPFAIAAIAAAVAGATIAFRRLAPAWEDALPEQLPEPIRRMLPPRRGGA